MGMRAASSSSLDMPGRIQLGRPQPLGPRLDHLSTSWGLKRFKFIGFGRGDGHVFGVRIASRLGAAKHHNHRVVATGDHWYRVHTTYGLSP